MSKRPIIKKIELASTNGREYLAVIVCSDGVWEFIDCDEAAKIVCRSKTADGKLDPHAAAEDLSKESWNRWMEDTGGEIADDITAIVQVLDVGNGGGKMC